MDQEQNYLYDDEAARRPTNPYLPAEASSNKQTNSYPAQTNPFPAPPGDPYKVQNPYSNAVPVPPSGYGIQNPYTTPTQPINTQPGSNNYVKPDATSDPYGDFRQLPSRGGNQRVIFNRATLSKPRWTYIFAGVLVAVFLGQMLTGGSIGGDQYDKLMTWGGLYKANVQAGEWWRIITPIFLHFGLTHILFNTLALLSFGTLLEQWFGAKRFVITFFLTGIAGNLLTLWIAPPNVLSAGASGAIFGILGAAIGFFYRHRGTLGGNSQSILRTLVINAGLNLVFTFSIPGISITAHLGGFVAGLFLGYFLSPLEVRRTIGDQAQLAATRSRDLILEWWPVAALIVAEVAVYFIALQTNVGVGRFQGI